MTLIIVIVIIQNNVADHSQVFNTNSGTALIFAVFQMWNFGWFLRTATHNSSLYIYIFQSNGQTVLVLPPYSLHKPGHLLSWQQVQLKMLNLRLFFLSSLEIIPSIYSIKKAIAVTSGCPVAPPWTISMDSSSQKSFDVDAAVTRQQWRGAVAGGGGVPWHCTLDVAG